MPLSAKKKNPARGGGNTYRYSRVVRVKHYRNMSAFQNGNHALTASRTDRNKTAARTFFFQHFRQTGDNTATGSGKRMTGGNGGTVHVQFAAVDTAQGLNQAEVVFAELPGFPGLQGLSNDRGKGFVNFLKIKILQG